MKKTYLKAAVLTCAALWAFTGAVSAQTLIFTMDFEPQDGVTSDATGSGTATLNTDTNFFEWEITFSGIESGLTNAHFHGPLPSTGVLLGIPHTTGETNDILIGSATISDTLKQQIIDQTVYANLHSNEYGGGEIMGVLVPEPSTYALFAGIAVFAGVVVWRHRRAKRS